jgi:hypothetical protein
MRTLAALLLLLLLDGTPAAAGVPCPLPFPNIQNGQPADASQVMANYNKLVSCLGQAAAAGNNNDITALTGMTTPLSPAQGGTQTYVATAPSTNVGNAYTVAATAPGGFVLTNGFSVVFVANATNSDAATLTVSGSSPAPILRRTQAGLLPTVGGEIIANTLTVATYDGASTAFQLLSNISPYPVGTVFSTLRGTADVGFVLMNGSCFATAGKFNALWTVLGSPAPSGGCSSGQFHMPDASGRFLVTAGAGFTLLGTGGTLTVSLATSNLPNVQLAYGDPSSGITDSYGNSPPGTGQAALCSVGGGAVLGGGSFVSGGGSLNPVTPTCSIDRNQSGLTSSLNGSQSQTALSVLNPFFVVNHQIKY